MYDTDFDDEPIVFIKGTSDKAPHAFGVLFQALYNQYQCGYDDGWTDAEEMLTEEDEFDC